LTSLVEPARLKLAMHRVLVEAVREVDDARQRIVALADDLADQPADADLRAAAALDEAAAQLALWSLRRLAAQRLLAIWPNVIDTLNMDDPASGVAWVIERLLAAKAVTR
jgi:hypothetical protein